MPKPNPGRCCDIGGGFQIVLGVWDRIRDRQAFTIMSHDQPCARGIVKDGEWWDYKQIANSAPMRPTIIKALRKMHAIRDQAPLPEPRQPSPGYRATKDVAGTEAKEKRSLSERIFGVGKPSEKPTVRPPAKDGNR